MTSVEEARQAIRAAAHVLPSETVPLLAAQGRLLRESICAAEDMPPFDRSAMDGYAIRADDPGLEFRIIDEVRAGDDKTIAVQSGEAVRIFTGARLPSPGLRVIMQEDVEADASHARLRSAASAATHIRPQGQDARAGDVLLEANTTLNPAALALIASVGKASVQVAPAPRVLHLTTGDEIVEAGQTLRPSEIRNSNAPLIAGLCRERGAMTRHLHARDDLATMIGQVDEAGPQNFDLLLVSGGSGSGKYDFTAQLFEHLQAKTHFRQVAVRPGKPLIFASTDRLLFGLPGNALSHFICFHLFVRPALHALLGRLPEEPLSAVLSEEIPEPKNARETWWPAKLDLRDGTVRCRALPWQSSGDITRLPAADALVRVPANTPALSVGAKVTYLPLRGPA